MIVRHPSALPVLVMASLALPGASGCAAGVSLAAAPSVDTRGNVGTEERLQAFAGVGTPDFRFFTALSAGGGHLGGASTGYFTLSPEVGVEGGRDLLWSVGTFYAPRFLSSGPVGVVHGGGAEGQVLFPLRRTGGDGGGLLLGPRLAAEAVALDPSLPEGKGTVGLFQLGVVLRWTTFDTTGNSWTN